MSFLNFLGQEIEVGKGKRASEGRILFMSPVYLFNSEPFCFLKELLGFSSQY